MASSIRYEKDNTHIVTVTFDQEGPVNVINDSLIEDFSVAVDRLEEEEELAGVILCSSKSTFIAGADLSMFHAEELPEPKDVFRMVERLKAALRSLESLGKPVVAAINGSVLGGGYEMTLAAHHRIAVDKPGAKIGLPEVSLGLLPGGGGVVRLSYLLGAQAALMLILDGKQMSPQKALGAGLVHALVDDEDKLIAEARAWIHANPEVKQPWDDKGYRIPGGRMPSKGAAELLAVAPGMLVKKTYGAFKAPESVLEVVMHTLSVDVDTALRVESREFTKLACSREASDMVGTFFFDLNAVKGGASRPKDVPESRVERLGVLGGGMMGRGIAQVAALRGMQVQVLELDEAAAEGALTAIGERLGAHPKREEAMSRIVGTANHEDLKGCDLIVEAVFESIELKHEMTKRCEPLLADSGFFASNTSTLPISLLAEASADPEHFIGLHFFSPVDRMPLLEIIRGKETSDETVARGFDFARQMGKTPIVVNDSPGFFTSRVFGTYLDEAAWLISEGVHPARIERLARMAGFAVGPLAVHDETSQTLTLKVAESGAQLEGHGYPPLPERQPAMSVKLSERLVNEFQRGGRAYGGGYYDYPDDGPKQLWPDLIELYYQEDYAISDEEIQERLMLRQSIETLRCLEEGVLLSERDGNIGSIFGIGFPPQTGGALQYLRSRGAELCLKRCEKLAGRLGARFEAPELLKEWTAS